MDMFSTKYSNWKQWFYPADVTECLLFLSMTEFWILAAYLKEQEAIQVSTQGIIGDTCCTAEMLIIFKL